MKNNNTRKTGGNYDWFQNGGKGKKQKTPKEHAKMFFKVMKILLYVALAALSLTGCVQSFIISTSNYTGQGMELYSKKEDIAPHMTTFKIDSKDASVTIDSKENYWLNDKKELKAAHDYVKNNGGDIATWKTENNAVQILIDGKYLGGKKLTHYNVNGKDQPLVLGQSQTKSAFNGYKPKSTKIPMWKFDKKKQEWILASTTALVPQDQFKPTQTTEDFQTIVFDVLYQELSKTKIFKDVAALKGTVPAINKANNQPTANAISIAKYQEQIVNLIKTTGVGPVATNKKELASDFSKITEFRSVKSSPLGFHQAAKTKLRAIYNWDTAWRLGPFYGLFVYPLSRLTLALVESMPMLNGWESLIAIALAVLIIRTFAYLLTFKSTLQQVKQQELSSKKAAIEAKYEQYKGNKQMEQRKRQEMSEMFKKEGVSPLGSIGSIFLTMPIFLAMWKIIGGIAHLKSTTWLGINFAQTSYKELFHGEWQYLPLMLTAAVIQGISIYIPRLLTKRRDKNRINAHQKKALKKANKTQNIMMAVFVFMALIFSAGLQIYWIFGGLFTIAQNFLNHYIIKWQSKRKKTKRVKS